MPEPGISIPGMKVRRATMDDLGGLSELWRLMGYSVDELSRRITDFQVVENAEGAIIGAVGFEITEKQGRIHSEAFTDFSLADRLRTALWERLMNLSANRAVLRVWTQEDAPFWRHTGLVDPDTEIREKLPLAWSKLPGRWTSLKLRDDVDTLLAAEGEFAIFMQSEKAKSERAMRHAKTLKTVATLIAAVVLIFVLMAGWYILRNYHNLGRR